MNYVTVFGPPSGVAVGMQFGLLVLLLGGVPAAVLATILSTGRRIGSRRWAGGWANVFLAGFVFQVSSLALTALLLVLLLWTVALDPIDVRPDPEDVGKWAGALVVSVLCSGWGLRCWRVLQTRVDDQHTSLNPDRLT